MRSVAFPWYASHILFTLSIALFTASPNGPFNGTDNSNVISFVIFSPPISIPTHTRYSPPCGTIESRFFIQGISQSLSFGFIVECLRLMFTVSTMVNRVDIAQAVYLIYPFLRANKTLARNSPLTFHVVPSCHMIIKTHQRLVL